MTTNDDLLPRDSRLSDSGDDLSASSTDRALAILTAVAVVIGVALRFAPRHGLWLDEALTVNIANLPLGDISEALRRDGHPPLYYVLLHFWTMIGGSSDWWVRALPALIGSVALVPTYFAGRRLAARTGAGPLGVRRTGLIALALMAILPYGIRYGAESRMYSLVILLVALGYLLVDELLSARRTGRDRVLCAVGVTLCTAALLWTHYWSMWLLASVGLVALWRAVKESDVDRRTGARLLVGALVVGGLLFLPWVPALLYQASRTGTPWGTVFGPASVVVITVVAFAGGRFGVAHLLTYLLIPLVLLGNTVTIRRVRDSAEEELVIDRLMAPRIRNELLVLGLTMVLGWATATASGNTYASRYAAVVYPLFVICIAGGLAVVRQQRLTAALLVVIIGCSILGAVGESRFARSQTDSAVEQIVQDVDANSVTDPVVIACPDQLGVALQRQVDQQLASDEEVVPYPTLGDPRFVDWVDYGERNQAAEPAAFVEKLEGMIDPRATIYLAYSPSYQTFEGQCEQLVELLGSSRDGSALAAMKPDDHDETLNLAVFRPRT